MENGSINILKFVICSHFQVRPLYIIIKTFDDYSGTPLKRIPLRPPLRGVRQ